MCIFAIVAKLGERDRLLKKRVYPNGYYVTFDDIGSELLGYSLTSCGNVFLKFNLMKDLKKSIIVHRKLWIEYFTGIEQ